MLDQIHPNLPSDTAPTLVHAFVSSKLDFMSNLLVGIADSVINKLQLIQDNAARIVLRKRKSDYMTPLLKQLHWLPVKSGIKFKICHLIHCMT